MLVAIGDAMLIESPEGVRGGGIAPSYAWPAALADLRAIPIARLGQDDRARRLRELLQHEQIDTSLLQSDPDLPTARMVVRHLAGRTQRTVEPYAAFDNLQWDFDLQDVAPQADIVVCGLRAQRTAQAGSVVRRFLDACATSLRVLDMTYRPEVAVERSAVDQLLERSDIIIADIPSWQALRLGGDAPSAASIAGLQKRGSSSVIAVFDDEGRLQLHAGASRVTGRTAWDHAKRAGAVVSLCAALLAGAAPEEAMARVDEDVAPCS